MRTTLMRPPVRGGALAHLVVSPRRASPVAPTGIGMEAPEWRAFKTRLLALLRQVAEVWPRADITALHSAMLQGACKEHALLQATDASLLAVLLRAAETRLQLNQELIPLVERDPRTAIVTVIPVETVKGLIRLMREAGARDITLGTVYEGETFREQFESGEKEFVHIKGAPAARVRAVAYYAIVDLPQQRWQAKTLTVQDVERRRQASAQPDHPSWRHHFHWMAQLATLRELAAFIPQGPARPRLDVGPLDDPAPTPMASLDPHDPYAAAPPRSADPSPDYEVTEEPLFASAREAAAEVLPGGPADLDGYGGCHLRHCPDHLLRRVKRWIANSADRAVRYARLSLAIDLVLRARRATQEPTTGPTT